MNTSQLAAMLMSMAAVVAFCLVVALASNGNRARWVLTSVALLVLIISVAATALGVPGQNAVVSTLFNQFHFERVYLVGITGGCTAGVLASIALLTSQSPLARSLSCVSYIGLAGAIALIVVKDAVSRVLPTPQEIANFQAEKVQGRFTVQKAASLSLSPTSIAASPDGTLFVCGYSGISYQHGVLIRVKRDQHGAFQETQVADYLNRPHGLAFFNNDLYVSRSGQFAHAVNGVFVQENTGAVTRLRDLNGDGVYDHAHDVISDLPGSQQPDGLHQNNGIAFDKEGRLYVTVGSPSDHGPGVHPYAGCILRANADGSDLSVFARGFRNPYDLAVDGSGRLLGTDNDAGDEPGDELNLIVEDAHYGHPYTTIESSKRVSGTTKPLLRFESAQGLCYAPPNSLPSGLDDCLYVASFTEGRIYKVTLSANGMEATRDFVASVPQCVDLAVSDGKLFAVSHEGRALYVLVPK